MSELQAEIYGKLNTVHALIHRKHFMMKKGRHHHGGFDPARGQGRVLALLKMQPEISTKDLSYLLGIRQQSLNELINKLEKAEYVVREQSEEDKRVMIVRLTEKGKEAQPEKKNYDEIFADFSDEELTSFSGYLDRLVSTLRKVAGEDEEFQKWMKDAHARMGDEKFERMKARRGFGERGGFGPEGRPGQRPE